MMKNSSRDQFRTLSIFAALSILFIFACKGPVDLMLGKWQVDRVTQDGHEIGGGKFRGTTYEFRENGTVWSQTPNGDSTTVKYERRGDTLVWVTMDRDVIYMIDSLTENFCRFSGDVDGFKTVIDMRRVGE